MTSWRSLRRASRAATGSHRRRVSPERARRARSLAPERGDGLLIAAASHAVAREDLALGNPGKGFGENFPAIGLENDALTGPPAPRVHSGVETLGEFAAVIVRVAFGTHVDVTLGLAQGLVVAAHILWIGIAIEHGADHEGSIDNFAKAQLLGEVIGTTEERAGRRAAFQEYLHAAEQHALAEGEIDVFGLQVLFERLQGGVMTAGLIANRNRHARQLIGRGDR